MPTLMKTRPPCSRLPLGPRSSPSPSTPPQGSAETAESSSDLVLARHDDRLHVYGRSPDNPATLIPRQMDGKTVRDALTDLLS